MDPLRLKPLFTVANMSKQNDRESIHKESFAKYKNDENSGYF